MDWPARIENYRKTIGVPYLGYENGWCYGSWFMGNSYQKRNNYFGGYQGNYLKRMRALFPERKRVLHLFSGMVDTAEFPGATLDIRADLHPTYCCDAETCEGVPLDTFDLVLADPPYSEQDAARYGTPLVNRNKVLALLSVELPVDALIVWLDQISPMYSSASLRKEALIGISGSTNHRFRCVTVFRRIPLQAR